MPEEEKNQQSKENERSTHYVVPLTIFDDSLKIRQLYLDSKALNNEQLKKKQGYFAIVGETDGRTRDKQLCFIEKIITILKPQLINEDKLLTLLNHSDKKLEESTLVESQLVAYKVLLSAYLFVRNSVENKYWLRSPSNSELYHFTNKILAISEDNNLENDIETLEICCNTTLRLISNQNELNNINAILRQQDMEFTEKEWKHFTDFLKKYAKNQEQHLEREKWPFCSLTEPLFGAIGGALGSTLAFVGGSLLASSSMLNTERDKLANSLGALATQGAASTFLVTTTTTSIIAPYLAFLFLNSFVKILPAVSAYDASKAVGRYFGFVIGCSLDLCLQLTKSLYQKAINYYFGAESGKTGLQLVGNKVVANGYVVNSSIDILKNTEAGTPEQESPSSVVYASSSSASSVSPDELSEERRGVCP